MSRNIVIAATPTCPFLSPLLHSLTHLPNLTIKILTPPTPKNLIPTPHSHGHGHDEHSPITHIQTSFEASELPALLKDADTLIFLLQGSDLHFSFDLITTASTIPSINLIIPSEFGLATSNPKIRDLLPPYETRHNIQEALRKSGKNWKAIYSGIILENAITIDGVLCLDCLWCSAVVFPHPIEAKIPISTYRDISKQIISVISGEEKGEGHEVFTGGFFASQDQIIKVVEKELDRDFDRYEAVTEKAVTEARERFKLGHFDGGVALMGRVAIWDEGVEAWKAWGEVEGKSREGWEKEVGELAVRVRKGESGGGGCGC